MSMEALTWARKQRVGNGRAKAVFMALADFANEDFTAFPSIKAVTEYTELDRKTIIKQIEFLAAAGFVVDTGDRRGITRQIPVYQLRSPTAQTVAIGPVAADKESQKRNRSNVGTVQEPKEPNSTETGTVPTIPDNSTNSDGKQYQVSAETVPTLGHGTLKEPSVEPTGNPASARAQKKSMEKAFDALWTIYPRKVAKGDAEKAYRKLDPDTALQAVLLEAAAKQSGWESWKEEGGKFVPHLATWLNGKRWTDEPPPKGDPAAVGAVSQQAAGDWWETASGIDAKGAELDVKHKAGEDLWRYKVRVFKKAGDGKWRDQLLADMLRTKNSLYANVYEFFNGHPPIGEAA